MTSRSFPLAHARVIDFGHHLAGPLAGLLLADQGAKVVKVDSPSASDTASPLAAVLNRGKQSLTLDLKTEPGRRSAFDLIQSSDVVIENFRPGVMDRLGLGAKTMSEKNPRLIYLSLPGFASDDLSHSKLPAWEGIIGAASGVYTDVNLLKGFFGLPPVYSALPYGSVYGAVHGALAVLMALIARERSGVGDIIEVPLVSAAISAMGSSILHIEKQPPRYDLPSVSRCVRRTFIPILRKILARANARWQLRTYEAALSMLPALMASYVCADNRLLYVFATDHRRHAKDLLACLGLLDEMERVGICDRDPYTVGGGRSNLAEASGWSRRRQHEIRLKIAERLRSKAAAIWEAELGAAGVPCAMQRTTAEWLSLTTLRTAGITVEVNHPDHGAMCQPGPHCWIRDWPTVHRDVRSGHATMVPEYEESIGAEKDSIRREDRTSTATKIEPALNGHLVLDLSTMVAGPACARTLAEYGADVIKIASPHPLHGPRMVCWFGIDVDQGKRSLLLDLTTDDGHRILQRLIERADILVHNFSEPAAARLGLRREDIASLSPRLVLCRLGAIEGPKTTSWGKRKAYDPVLQAASGIMTRYGSVKQPEYHGLASCIDYLTGYCAAFGAALALFKRTRDPEKKGSEAITSLAQGAELIQASFAFDFSGRAWTEPSGQQCRGDHALHRLYRAHDCWIFLAAKPEKRDALLAVLRIFFHAGDSLTSGSDLARCLEDRLCKKTSAHWQRVFRPLDIAVFPVRTLREIRRAIVTARPETRYLIGGPSVQLIRQLHPVGSHVDTLAPAYARLTQSPVRYLDPAPKPGTHSLQILEELGIGERERKRLLDTRSVAVELSKQYLPP